jgi:hypothetical protein
MLKGLYHKYNSGNIALSRIIEMCRLLVCEGKTNSLSALRRVQDGKSVLKDEPSMDKDIILQMLEEHIQSTPIS